MICWCRRYVATDQFLDQIELDIRDRLGESVEES